MVFIKTNVDLRLSPDFSRFFISILFFKLTTFNQIFSKSNQIFSKLIGPPHKIIA